MINSVSNFLIKTTKNIENRISRAENLVENEVLTTNIVSQIIGLLNDTEKTLDSNERFIEGVLNVLTPLQNIISILTKLPIPTAPIPIPVGVIMTLSQKLIEINQIITGIRVILTIYQQLFIEYRIRIATVRSKLIIDSITNDITKSDVNNIATLGDTLLISDIKGYAFYLVSEIGDANYLKNYAVARKDGVDVYKTEYSYTLNPSVLISQLKQIVEDNDNN